MILRDLKSRDDWKRLWLLIILRHWNSSQLARNVSWYQELVNQQTWNIYSIPYILSGQLHNWFDMWEFYVLPMDYIWLKQGDGIKYIFVCYKPDKMKRNTWWVKLSRKLLFGWEWAIS